MARSRLHTIAPDLDAALTKAPTVHRRAAAWAVARWAVECVGLSHPAVTEALSGSHLGGLGVVVAELDKRYFELAESGRATQVVFGHARAASAVEFAARGEVAEAVYEAAIATDDVPGVRAVVASVLGIAGPA